MNSPQDVVIVLFGKGAASEAAFQIGVNQFLDVFFERGQRFWELFKPLLGRFVLR